MFKNFKLFELRLQQINNFLPTAFYKMPLYKLLFINIFLSFQLIVKICSQTFLTYLVNQIVTIFSFQIYLVVLHIERDYFLIFLYNLVDFIFFNLSNFDFNFIASPIFIFYISCRSKAFEFPLYHNTHFGA